MKRVSAKRARQLRAWAKVRRAVFARAGGRCEGAVAPVCTGLATQVHHVVARSQGGEDSEDNLLALCGPGGGRPGCHAWVHANPDQARDCGLIGSRS